MVRGAMNYFDRIQSRQRRDKGGACGPEWAEAGESPKRALTAEPTRELAKRIVAHRVAHLFDFGGVALALRDRCGYRSGRTPCQNQKSVATPHILCFSTAC